MTNLSQETLLKHIEEELPRSERNYKENQLWKEGGVADALQTAMRRKKLIAFLLISLCLFVFALAVFQAAISPSHPSPSYLVSMGTTILSFFFTQRLVCSNSRLELLSEL